MFAIGFVIFSFMVFCFALTMHVEQQLKEMREMIYNRSFNTRLKLLRFEEKLIRLSTKQNVHSQTANA